MSAPTPTDFPGPDPYYAPEPGGLFFGVEPTLLVCALLILLAVAILMYVLGLRRFGMGGGSSDEAPAEIHAAVLKASREAMAADSNLLRQRAQALRDLIERLLGPVLVVGNGLGGPVKALDAALKGKIKDDHGGHDAGHGGGHGGDHGAPVPVAHCVHRGGHEPCTPACGSANGGGGAAAAASTIAIITLPPQPAPVPPPPPHAPAPPPPGEDKMRDMSHEEQTDALARAVRKFHDHWSKSDQRIRELKAARAALSRLPPAQTSGVPGERVWDKH